MTLTHRRIIYLVFMAVFFVSLPLLILQATGYRYNSKKNILQKTGIIFVESKPKEAEVWLNNNLTNKQTPLRIKNLLPNEYQLKLTKQGYKEWQKKINVLEGQTTNVQYVRLFKDDAMPELLLAGEISEIVQGNDDTKLILLKENEGIEYEISMFDLRTNGETLVWDGRKAPEHLELLNNDNQLAIFTENNLELIDLASKNTRLNLQEEIGRGQLSQIKLDEFNSNFIYFLESGELSQFNLLNHELTNLSIPAVDYLVRGSQVYLLNNSTLNKTWLNKINLTEPDKVKNLLALERSGDYKIVSAEKDIVGIRDETAHELILWDETKNEEEVLRAVNYYVWDKNHQELLFGNDWELWLYQADSEKDKYTLITRLGETISEATWYPTETHILYVVANQIKVTENLVANRYTTDLGQLEIIKNMIVNKKGDNIYFIGQVGKQKGLYKLEIQ